jgi:tryptophan halogenase
MAWAAAKAGKFDRPAQDPRNVLSTFLYAYHFDAHLYAAYLRTIAEKSGVRRIEGKVLRVEQNSLTGFVEQLHLTDGSQVDGELFIDCSGLHALLIGKTLEAGFEDWSRWLPCDRAVAMPSTNTQVTPYTRSTAHAAGWQWRIPLQHRTGNGHVYSSSFTDDATAEKTLRDHIEGSPLADPRIIRFKPGCRTVHWDKNVIAIGLSSGFIEPLESTSIHLIQAGISKLLAYFPDKTFDPIVTREFNRVAVSEVERIRDFIILHYCLTTRDDSEMWRYCASMPIPDSLQTKIEHFRRFGRILPSDMDIFGPSSWLAVHVGQGNIPQRTDPIMGYRSFEGGKYLEQLRQAMERAAQSMPTHEAYIDRHCKAI